MHFFSVSLICRKENNSRGHVCFIFKLANQVMKANIIVGINIEITGRFLITSVSNFRICLDIFTFIIANKLFILKKKNPNRII